MKRLFTILLALTLVMSLSVAVFAEDGYTDQTTVTISKKYKSLNGGANPAETFTFSDFTEVDIKENPAAEFPSEKPTITSISYEEGEATAEGVTKTATITLPTYTAVGIYTYSFNEITPAEPTAGVTYNSTTLYLVVTVVEENGVKRVAAVHCEGSHDANAQSKTDLFENKYESGTLAVTKEVTGNLGDKTKYFNVTVTFTAASGEVINSTITYTGGQYAQAVTVTNNTATIQVKDGDTVTFTNVPEGVTWTVVEDTYSDYTTTYSTDSDTIAAGDADTCTITNNKDVTVDTGISLDSLPYILLLVAVAAVVVVMIIRKRRAVED